MRVLYGILFLLIFSSQTFSQQIDIKDYLLNSNNSPSTFIQQNPRLYYNNSDQFFVVWEDYRNGVLKYFGQRFDSSGNKIGKNFEALSNELSAMNLNGEIFQTSELITSYYFSEPITQLIGKIIQIGYSSTDYLVYGSLPHYDVCGMGFAGIKREIFPMDNKFILFTYDYGNLVKRDIVLDGSSTNEVIITGYEKHGIHASNFSSAVTSNGNHATLFLTNENCNSYEIKDSIKSGIYGSFYDKNDSAFVTLKLIAADDSNIPYNLFSTIKIFSLDDSTYLGIYNDFKNAVLNFQKFDLKGNKIDSSETLSFDFPDSQFENITEKKYDDKFAIVFSYTYPDKNFRIFVDKSGKIISGIEFDTALNYKFNNSFLKNENELFTVKKINSDIYLQSILNNEFKDSLKINDDINGSNETSPSLVKFPDKKILVSFTDENSIRSKFITSDLYISTEENKINGRPVKSFSDNSFVTSWKIWKPDYKSIYGISFYDDNFNLIKNDTLLFGQDYDDNVFYSSLNDSTFLINIRVDNNILQLRNKSGIIKEKEFERFESIFIEDENSFWIATANSVTLFNDDFNAISETFAIPNIPVVYLGNNNFVYLTRTESPYFSGYFTYYAKIINVNGTIIKDEIPISSTYSFNPDYKIFRLNDNSFGIIYPNGNEFLLNSYSITGKKIIEKVKIHSNSGDVKQNPAVLIYDNKVFFAWQDNRIPENGFDIYFSQMDLGTLTSVERIDDQVPEEFALLQNYPNPFNPSTAISYQLSAQSKVELKIFDILGREVQTLVNEIQDAGNYKVTFDASKLSSGIYIYQIKAGNFIQSKKMNLIK